MNRIKTTQAREEFGAVINKVAYGKEHFIVHRRGKDLAAIIPMEEFQLLEEYIEKLEDKIDLMRAKETLKEGGELIPHEEIAWEQKEDEIPAAVHKERSARSRTPASKGKRRNQVQNRAALRRSASG
jgi:prevent-host-death family protein